MKVGHQWWVEAKAIDVHIRVGPGAGWRVAVPGWGLSRISRTHRQAVREREEKWGRGKEGTWVGIGPVRLAPPTKVWVNGKGEAKGQGIKPIV